MKMKGVSTIYDYNYRARKGGAIGTLSDNEWHELCQAYGNRCIACGRRQMLTPDHIIPISKGGTNYIDNIQPMCHSCNSAKRALVIDFRTNPFPGIGWERKYTKGHWKR